MGRAPEAAARHGLSAIIAGDLQPVPEALARDARSQVAAGLKIRLLTLAVVDALRAEGVTPTLLKGYGLAVRLYAEPLARPSADVDVLVTPDQLPASERALLALGLVRQDDASLADPFEEHHHLSFSGPRGLVELHFRLFTGFGGGAFDEVGLRERSRPFELDGRPVRLLAPEDELLYLATHAANHAFLRLSWLVDLARYLQLQPLDWPTMADRARAAGFQVAVTSALATVQRVLGVQLPEGARQRFPESFLRRTLDSRLFSPRLVTSARLSGHPLASFALRVWLVDSPAHGVRHLLEGARRYARRASAGG